jgi:hypothetical protein
MFPYVLMTVEDLASGTPEPKQGVEGEHVGPWVDSATLTQPRCPHSCLWIQNLRVTRGIAIIASKKILMHRC